MKQKKKYPWYVNATCVVLAGLSGVLAGNILLMKQEARRFELEQRANSRRLESFLDVSQNPIALSNLWQSSSSTNMPYADNPDPEEGSDIPKSKESSVPESKDPYNPRNPVTEDFVMRIIQQESNGNPRAVSEKGARGLMQIMPATWKQQTEKVYGRSLPLEQAFDPEKSRETGTNYLREIDTRFLPKLPGYVSLPLKQKQRLIAAAYNGGPGRLLRLKGKISLMPKETRDYVASVVPTE